MTRSSSICNALLLIRVACFSQHGFSSPSSPEGSFRRPWSLLFVCARRITAGWNTPRSSAAAVASMARITWATSRQGSSCKSRQFLIYFHQSRRIRGEERGEPRKSPLACEIDRARKRYNFLGCIAPPTTECCSIHSHATMQASRHLVRIQAIRYQVYRYQRNKSLLALPMLRTAFQHKSNSTRIGPSCMFFRRCCCKVSLRFFLGCSN